MARAANPYLGSDPRWQRQGTYGLINPSDTLVRVEQSRKRDNERILFAVLGALAVPVLRRTLEAILVFDYHFHALEVTDTLAALLERKQIEHLSLKFERQGNDLYFIGKRTRKEKERYGKELAKLYTERETVILNNLRLKIAGERFVRAMLLQSGRFSSFKENQFTSGNEDEIDLIATEIATGNVYGISVKNENEWMFRQNTAIRDVHNRAKKHNVKPWLVASFVTDEARSRCASNRPPIRIDSMNAQIVPSEFNTADKSSQFGKKRMKSALTRLASVTGPQPFILMPQRFRFEHYEKYRSSPFDSMSSLN